MNIDHLQLLGDLARHRSVAAVAVARHRTPSAVSQQLKVASRQLGVALTEADGRGIRLTEAGRFLAELSAELEGASGRAQARWDAWRGQSAGTVRVASLPSAAAFLMPPALAALAGTGIRIELSDVDLREAGFAELSSRYDIVIGHSLAGPTPVGAEALCTVTLAREPLDAAMALGHRLAAKKSVTARQLAAEEWVGVPEGYPFDTIARAVAAKAGRDLRIAQRLIDNRLVERLIAAGDRVAVLPRFTTPVGKVSGIVLRPIADVPATHHVVAIMRHASAERLVVRRMIAELVRIGQAMA